MRLALSKNTCHAAALFPQHGLSQVDLRGQEGEEALRGAQRPCSQPPTARSHHLMREAAESNYEEGLLGHLTHSHQKLKMRARGAVRGTGRLRSVRRWRESGSPAFGSLFVRSFAPVTGPMRL